MCIVELCYRTEKAAMKRCLDTSQSALLKKQKVREPLPFRPPSFGVHEAEEWKQYLDQHGYAVIHGVLGKKQLRNASDKLWNYLENLGTGIKREDNKTWDNENWPGTLCNGILSREGIGQSELQWYLRPIVKPVFQKLWNKDDLVTSFDGVGVFRPPSVNKKWRTKGGWYHVDQNGLLKPDLECIQGLVTLLDADRTTGGFVVLPGSHLKFAKFFQEFPGKGKKDFIMMDPSQVQWFNIEPVMLEVKRGSMILWDSRAVHCNAPGVQPNESTDLIRAVSYQCMMPAEMLTDKVRMLREAAPAKGISTSHWPLEFHPTKPPRWPRKGKPFLWSAVATDLNEEQWALVVGSKQQQQQQKVKSEQGKVAKGQKQLALAAAKTN